MDGVRRESERVTSNCGGRKLKGKYDKTLRLPNILSRKPELCSLLTFDGAQGARHHNSAFWRAHKGLFSSDTAKLLALFVWIADPKEMLFFRFLSEGYVKV